MKKLVLLCTHLAVGAFGLGAYFDMGVDLLGRRIFR